MLIPTICFDLLKEFYLTTSPYIRQIKLFWRNFVFNLLWEGDVTKYKQYYGIFTSWRT